MTKRLCNFTSSPMTTDGVDGHWSGKWMVWDMYQDPPPIPVFTGTMEDCGLVADALNRRHTESRLSDECGDILTEPVLLPCPFCGDDNAMMLPPTCRPETPYNPADRLFPIVRCGSCCAEVSGENEDYRGKSAIAAWNRRAPSGSASPPQEGELVERLRARKGFFLNGAHWLMSTEPDHDCAEAATRIAELTARLAETERKRDTYLQIAKDNGANFIATREYATALQRKLDEARGEEPTEAELANELWEAMFSGTGDRVPEQFTDEALTLAASALLRGYVITRRPAP